MVTLNTRLVCGRAAKPLAFVWYCFPVCTTSRPCCKVAMLCPTKLPTYLHSCQELASNVDSFHECEKNGTSKLATKRKWDSRTFGEVRLPVSKPAAAACQRSQRRAADLWGATFLWAHPEAKWGIFFQEINWLWYLLLISTHHPSHWKLLMTNYWALVTKSRKIPFSGFFFNPLEMKVQMLKGSKLPTISEQHLKHSPPINL